MKRIFTDGYIEINKKGNTYLGKTAHEIMHIQGKLLFKLSNSNTKLVEALKNAQSYIITNRPTSEHAVGVLKVIRTALKLESES